MVAVKCQICQKRDAIKSITTSLDDGSFYVCGKKKCSKEVYKMLKNPPSLGDENLGDSSHNPMDWQGRSFDNIKGTELVAFWSMVLAFCAIIAIILFNIFS